MKAAIWVYVVVVLLLAGLVAGDALSYRKRLPLEVRMHVLGHRFYEVPAATSAEGSGVRLGYRCARAGLLGSDLALWDCRFAEERGWGGLLIRGEKAERLSARYPTSQMMRSSWNRYGAAGLLLLPIMASLLSWLLRFPIESLRFRLQLRSLRRQAALKKAREELRGPRGPERDPLCGPDERPARKHQLPETDEIFTPGLVEPILKYWSDWTPDPYGTNDPLASTSGSKS